MRKGLIALFVFSLSLPVLLVVWYLAAVGWQPMDLLTMALPQGVRNTISHELLASGDFATGRAILRNYINASMGFPELARKTNISSPSLQRMFGPKGNPSAANLFGVIAALHKAEQVNVELHLLPIA